MPRTGGTLVSTMFLVVVLTMTVPTQLSVIPQYLIMSELGWVDTLQALIVPGLASAFGIFWMRQHISATISDELMQAARIDGASTGQVFWRIAFPIVRPAAFVLGLFGFVTAWNDFLWPFIVLKSPERYTAQIAIKAPSAEGLAGIERPGIPLLMELLNDLQESPCANTATLLERWRGRPDFDPLFKLASAECHFDAAGAARELNDALAQLFPERGDQRLDELLRKQAREGLTRAERTELQGFLTKPNDAYSSAGQRT